MVMVVMMAVVMVTPHLAAVVSVTLGRVTVVISPLPGHKPRLTPDYSRKQTDVSQKHLNSQRFLNNPTIMLNAILRHV